MKNSENIRADARWAGTAPLLRQKAICERAFEVATGDGCHAFIVLGMIFSFFGVSLSITIGIALLYFLIYVLFVLPFQYEFIDLTPPQLKQWDSKVLFRSPSISVVKEHIV